MDEPDMIELAGSDFTLYLKFLKFTAIMFLLLSLINCAILIPIYATGKPRENEVVINLSKITILNIFGSREKVWVSFGFVYINSIAAYIIVYLFWKSTQRLSFHNY